MPDQGLVTALAQPEDRDARLRPGFSLLIRKAMGFPGMTRVGLRDGMGTAFCFFFKDSCQCCCPPPKVRTSGEETAGMPPALIQGKTNNSEPIIPNALQPKNNPQDCFSLSDETAHCLELANATTAGVSHLYSQPDKLI